MWAVIECSHNGLPPHLTHNKGYPFQSQFSPGFTQSEISIMYANKIWAFFGGADPGAESRDFAFYAMHGGTRPELYTLRVST